MNYQTVAVRSERTPLDCFSAAQGMFSRWVLRSILILFFAGCAALAQEASEPIATHEVVKGSVYWIEGGDGGSGNAGVVIGPAGVIIINAKINATAGRQVVEEVAKLTAKPITHVILTHSDGQNGLAGFPDGLTIIAHENCKKEMEQLIGGRGAPPLNRIPNSVITQDKESRTIDGVKVEFRFFGPSHTTGDLTVYFPEFGALFTGNIITTQYVDPFVHPEKGGGSEGWIRTVAGMIAMNATTYVPGHGPAQTKAEMQKRLASAQEKKQQVVALMKEGKSLDQIRETLHDVRPAIFRDRGTWVEVVYHELAGR